jgi:NAD(P)-dependent dehydrogenase (short-subunit alcohol dehydrogenase family)
MPKELHEKTILVTGASSGVGLVSAKQLAARGAHVVLAVRNRAKCEPVKADIERDGGSCEILELDTSDLASVKSAADRFLASGRALDVLMNNAGQAGARGISKDGFELTFATNHLGHFLLTEKLLPLLKAAPQGRVVNVSSKSHYQAKAIDWDALRKPSTSVTGLPEYEVSKLCNVLHAKELARRLEGTKVTTYSLHPGVVATDAWRQIPGPIAWLMKRFMITSEDGAKTQIRCAAAPELATETGLYYDSEKPRTPSKLARDEALARELWDKSAAWVAPFLA